jgi:ferredoxin-like protein FixX
MNKAKLSLLLLVATATSAHAQHPLERQLAQLKPIAVVPLVGLAWPSGTLLCPLTPYQSALPGASSTAQRVNAFLEKKRFQGDEGHWSLVVVKPDGIEQLVFKRGKYDVVASSAQLSKAADSVTATFELKECVEVQEARVLATRSGASNRTLLHFGVEKLQHPG